jgi:plastocyanin
VKNVRKGIFGLALVAVAAVPVLFSGGGAAQAAGGDNINIKIGAGEPGYSVNAFLPDDLTVKTGDTVTWNFDWFEPHMVALINGNVDPSGPEPAVDPSPFDFDGVKPFVYSGTIFGPNQKYSIKFEKAGDYHIECFIHPGMSSDVKVVDSGTTDTQATADSRGASQYATALTALKNVAAPLKNKPATVTPRADGTSLFDVQIDSGDPAAARDDLQQFFPATTNVKVGDTIRWTNTAPTPHTVTFNLPADTPPDTDPFSVPPSTPAATFDGTGFWHSGILMNLPEDPTTPTQFEMTFSKVGTFNYICVLHAPQGMTGSVTVSAQTTPPPTTTAVATPTKAPGAPNTGSGAQQHDQGAGAWLIAAAVAMAAAAGWLAIFAARRA